MHTCTLRSCTHIGRLGTCYLCPLFYGLAPPYFITQSSSLFLFCVVFFLFFSFFPPFFSLFNSCSTENKSIIVIIIITEKNNYNNLLIKSTKLVYQIEKFNSLRPAMSCIFPFIFTCLLINLPCPFHSNNNNNNN